MFLALCVMLTITLTNSEDPDLDDLWTEYKEIFGIIQDIQTQEDEDKSRAIWEKNVKDILQFNTEADMGLHSYRKGLNQFTQFDDEEFTSAFGAILPDSIRARNSSWFNSSTISKRALPTHFDWREKNIITPVRDQGQCEGCWAFATTYVVEAHLAMKTKVLQELSAQQLIECGKEMGLDGCVGGWPEDAYEYIKKYGQDSENCYPTTTKCTWFIGCSFYRPQKSCKYNAGCVTARLAGYENIAADEDEIMNKVVNGGPVLVCYYANKNFMHYKSGIFYDSNCSEEVNHCGLIVGYGSEKGIDYWILKNTWGPNWGENGYVRIQKNKNTCQLANYATIPKMQ